MDEQRCPRCGAINPKDDITKYNCNFCEGMNSEEALLEYKKVTTKWL